MMEGSGRTPDGDAGRGGDLRLGLLFGALYFLQGFGEPTDGLMAQPVRTLLGTWGRSVSEIATFSALLAIPWALKPLFGLLSDFVPLGRSRRKGYLIAMSAVTATTLVGLWAFPVAAGASGPLLGRLWVATVAVAFSDVVADALMIEQGQPRGLTGRLQAIQWGSMYAAATVTGVLGGALSERHREPLAFLLCGAGGVLTLALAVFAVSEPPRPRPSPGREGAAKALGKAARSPAVLGVGAFLFLWNFNPFSTVVVHLHMTRVLGLGEQFYGYTASLMAMASIAACLAYGTYCRRVPMPLLVHLSIALGVASTLAYVAVTDERSAVLVALAVGFTYMTATLIQLDLAARVCPPEAAGTVFATIMALENLGTSASIGLGGRWYDAGTALWGSRTAFHVLVGVGAALTASCWLIVPFLPRHAFGPPTLPGRDPGNPPKQSNANANI